MTWMGLDIGTRRIGVALSDDASIIAHPHTTLEVGGAGRVPIEALGELVRERGVGGIVVGLPRRMDGSWGPECDRAQEFAVSLEAGVGVDVVLWDERLTSAQAERLLVEAGVRRKKRRGATDRMAAALILQSFLDRRALTPAVGDGAGGS